MKEPRNVGSLLIRHLSPDERAQLAAWAKDEDLTVGQLIRRLIRAALDERQKQHSRV